MALVEVDGPIVFDHPFVNRRDMLLAAADEGGQRWRRGDVDSRCGYYLVLCAQLFGTGKTTVCEAAFLWAERRVWQLHGVSQVRFCSAPAVSWGTEWLVNARGRALRRHVCVVEGVSLCGPRYWWSCGMTVTRE